VLDDVEEYASVEAFVADAPTQSTRAFETIRFLAAEDFEVVVRRRGEPTGVTLTAPSPAVLERVVPAVTRGSLQWRWARRVPGLGRVTNYVPPRSTDVPPARSAEEALRAANRRRERLMRPWAAAVLFGLFVAGAALSRVVDVADGGSFALATGVAALAAAGLALLRPIRDHVLPPIEIAGRTPGRRFARALTALAAPFTGALIKLLTG
jgi:hypothetical protein